MYFLKKQPDEAEALFYWANTLDEEKEPRPGKENPLLLWLMETVLLAEEADKTTPPNKKEQTTEGGIILPSWVENRGGFPMISLYRFPLHSKRSSWILPGRLKK